MSDNKNDEVLDDLLEEIGANDPQPLDEAAELLKEAAERHDPDPEDEFDPDAPKEFDLSAEEDYYDERPVRRNPQRRKRKRKKKMGGNMKAKLTIVLKVMISFLLSFILLSGFHKSVKKLYGGSSQNRSTAQ